MLTVTIVDYGAGNLFSVRSALEKCGVDKIIFANSPSQILEADRLILPGVGAFLNGMTSLKELDLVDPIKEYAKLGKPLLGICLGMQMLGSESNEFGTHAGLNLIPGNIVKIPSKDIDGTQRKVPFVGWAELEINSRDNLLSDLPNNPSVYLVHSYHFSTDDKKNTTACYQYNGMHINAAIQHDNIIGLQFHPEKSSKIGLQIIEKFIYL